MLVLRMIRQPRWDQPLDSPWQSAEDIPADPLADFANTTDNTLSVWLVDDDLANLCRVVTAMAASRDKVDKFDYVLFPLSHLANLNLQVAETPGDTPDDRANSLHRDVVKLSAGHVYELTKRVFREHVRLGRVLQGDIGEWILQAVRSGDIPLARLNRRLRAVVEEMLASSAPQ